MTRCLTCSVLGLLVVRQLVRLEACVRTLVLLSLLLLVLLLTVTPISGGLLRQMWVVLPRSMMQLSTFGMQVLLVASSLKMRAMAGTFVVESSARPPKSVFLGMKTLVRPGRLVLFDLARSISGSSPMCVTLTVCRFPVIDAGFREFFPMAGLPVMITILMLSIWLTLAIMLLLSGLLAFYLVRGSSLRKGSLGLRSRVTCLCGRSPLWFWRCVMACVPPLVLESLLLVMMSVSRLLTVVSVRVTVAWPVLMVGVCGLSWS